MDKYEHISKMEAIMNDHAKLLEQLGDLLDLLEAREEDHHALIDYYYSDQRSQDLEDDRKGLIPQTLRRGVLSEDEIYDLLGEDYTTGIRMMELALKLIKRE